MLACVRMCVCVCLCVCVCEGVCCVQLFNLTCGAKRSRSSTAASISVSAYLQVQPHSMSASAQNQGTITAITRIESSLRSRCKPLPGQPCLLPCCSCLIASSHLMVLLRCKQVCPMNAQLRRKSLPSSDKQEHIEATRLLSNSLPELIVFAGCQPGHIVQLTLHGRHLGLHPFPLRGGRLQSDAVLHRHNE